MKKTIRRSMAGFVGAMLVMVGVTFAPPTQAQMAVIDVAAIMQFLEQIAALQQQLSTLRNQLDTAKDQLGTTKDEFKSTTGSRGMEQLLGNEARNYLPRNWPELESTLKQASSTFGALGRDAQSIEKSNAVLSDATLARYSPRERDIILAERRRAASLQAMTRQALAATSQRFDSMSELVHAIGGAQDQKAILDLSARIGAEQAMLANEQTKLQSLQHAAEAEAAARAQRVREASAAGVGNMRTLPPLGL
jgi:type IV secretion system protein VirB5